MKKPILILAFILTLILCQEVKSQITCTLNITYTPPTAFAMCNASASVTYSGTGSASLCPVTYTWVPGLYTSSTVNNICAGTYTVYANFGGGPTCCGLTTGVVVIPNGPTSINNLQLSQEIIYFDNSSSIVQLKNINKHNLSMIIIDVAGKEIKSFHIDDASKEINLKEFMTGVYFLVLYSDKEIIARQKIIQN